MLHLRPLTIAGAMLAAVCAGTLPAGAVPFAPTPGLSAGGNLVETARTTKRERMMRRMNTHRHGDPNARNPERPGYKQQLGNTSGGPRY